MILDWLIVGGGIHGVHLAARLLGEAEVARDRLAIVDPAASLLHRWRACTQTTGMTHLRSPSVHHLDLSPWSLKRFAGQRRHQAPGLFAYPYNRPALGLFNDHCDQVLEEFQLGELHIKEMVDACSVDCARVTVQLAGGERLEARNVVLAIGAGEEPAWPSWAPSGEPRVAHIFDKGFDAWPVTPERVAVVGGGISAGQVALRLMGEGHEVQLISRHELREHQFDSDPGWLGPKSMVGFGREGDFDRRRALITEARHRGSVPPKIRRALRRAIHRGQLEWHVGQVEQLVPGTEQLGLRLDDQQEHWVDRVLLATGFTSRRPGGKLVDELIASASLPCASCGYPIVDSALRWHPRIFVSGPLAELELGPAARNIAGARRAGDRLVAAVCG